MGFIFVACMICLILIAFDSFRSVDKKVKLLRLRYAIPTFLALLASGYVIYLWVIHENYQKIPIFKEYPMMMVLPVAVVLLCFLFYHSKKRKEAVLQTDIAGRSIEKVRFQKHYERKAFDLSSESLEVENKKE